jgi:endonuclease/exonuclease/phosphatase (EEP) superfamily protein YafD
VPLSFAARALSWAVLAVLGLLALLRLVAWDDWWPLVIFDALTLYLYLPAWLIAAGALLRKRWWLATAAVGMVCVQAIYLAPEFSAASPLPSWSSDAMHVRLFDANVNEKNSAVASYEAVIKQTRPDLVTLEEATPVQVASLDATGVLAGLRHRIEVDRFDPWAFLVVSRYPLSRVRVVTVAGRPLIVETTVALPSGPLRLWVVHTIAPLPGIWRDWKHQLNVLANQARLTGNSRLLIAGDFNADWQSQGFRAILATGLVDGAAARGDALSMTWPQLHLPVPPLVRIDHVLTGTDVAVSQISTGAGPGSDHRYILATIALNAHSLPKRVQP